MSSSTVSVFVNAFLQASRKLLSLTPIDISYCTDFCFSEQRENLRKIQTFWSLHFCLSFIFTITEIYYQLTSENQSIQTTFLLTIFHGHLLVAKTCTIVGYIVFNIKTAEMCHFLNCLITSSHELIPKSMIFVLFKPITRNGLFPILLGACSIGILLTYTTIIPAVVFIAPCFNHAAIFSKISDNLSMSCHNASILVRIFATLFQAFLLTPVGILGSTSVALAFLTLEKIRGYLKQLRFLTNETRTNADFELRLCVGKIYRRIQLFVILSNLCFQTYFWPLFQFLGSVGVISILYPLLMLQNELPKLHQVSLLIFTMVVITLCCIILDIGSQSIIYSRKILRDVKNWGNCKWSVKFFRSCPAIALRVGEFHEMDRERAPAFIRFILQRTAVLVINTKSDFSS